MKNWEEIRAWRRATRQTLVAERLSIPADQRWAAQATICARIRSGFPELEEAAVGFYWPIKGEIDLRPLMRELLAVGADAALPVVVQKNRPLEFWEWQHATKLTRGIGNIPVPSERKPVQPTALLIPLLGFDTAGHRLGYGGGYYDRTLADYRLAPFTIGVGRDSGCLETIYPQAHDFPLDAIVTESRCLRFGERQTESGLSSPPCYLHEFDSEKEP